MVKDKDKTKPGRPRILTEAKTAILEACFRDDATIKEACAEAEISVDTYERELKRNEVFLRRITLAQQYPLTIARKCVMESLKTDARMAMRYLERRDPRYNPRINTIVETRSDEEELDALELAANYPSYPSVGDGLEPLPAWLINK
jgi:hypothetical protein